MFTLGDLADFISSISNLLSISVWVILELSSLIGQKLIDQLFIIISYTKQISEVFYALLHVLHEDLCIFLEDIKEKSKFIFVILADGAFLLGNGISEIAGCLVCAVTKFCGYVFDIINCVMVFLTTSFSFSKMLLTSIVELFYLIGASIWLAITKTPVAIIHCFTEVIEEVENVFAGAKVLCLSTSAFTARATQNMMRSIFDMPFGPITGLLLGFTTIYYVVRNFRRIIIFIFEVFLYSCHCVSSLINNLWTGNFLKRRHADVRNISDCTSDIAQDKLCVACQDNFKEVIIFPCRHVCLCLECSLHIEENHRVCPICRTNIRTTMRVYI